MSVDTAWLVITVLCAAGSAGALLRWLLDKTHQRESATVRTSLVLGLTLLACAVISSAITLLR